MPARRRNRHRRDRARRSPEPSSCGGAAKTPRRLVQRLVERVDPAAQDLCFGLQHLDHDRQTLVAEPFPQGAECVIANNSEPELAQKLAAYLLSAQAQSRALAVGNIVPSNTTVTASTPEAEKKLADFHKDMQNAVTLDWDVINAKRPEWNSRWNKMIER
jgi:ABC-type thiamine transport system substrate-binding protein